MGWAHPPTRKDGAHSWRRDGGPCAPAVKQALRSLLAAHDGYQEEKARLWQLWAREEVTEFDATPREGPPSIAHWRREFWECGTEVPGTVGVY